MTDEPILVRYAYLTPKGLALLEAIEKALSDVHLERIPKDQEPPLPSTRRLSETPDQEEKT